MWTEENRTILLQILVQEVTAHKTANKIKKEQWHRIYEKFQQKTNSGNFYNKHIDIYI